MRIRTVWGIALLLLTALPVWSQEETIPPEPARFLIERITVEGPKAAAANIVRAETLLREGNSYTEDQLRQAVSRVHRLPFVLDASFALRKGSQRGAYELVIAVAPARWFFYDHWIRAFSFDQPLDIGNETFRGDRSSTFFGGLAGARLFVGRSGVLFGALDSEEGVQAGFTRYDLFHRGILASAGISSNACCVTEVLPLALDPSFSSWVFSASRRISLGLSIPLGGPQSIQVALSDRQSEHGTRHEVLLAPGERFSPPSLSGGELNYRRAEAKWVWDTSDDPLVPTRGLGVSVGVEASRFAVQDVLMFRLDPPAGEPFASPFPPIRSRQVAAAVSAVRHWPVTPRQTISIQGRFSAGRSQLDEVSEEPPRVLRANVETYGGSAGVEHALTLRRSRRAGELTDLRLESGVEIGAEKITPDFGSSPLERFSAYTSLVFRNAWGRVRLILTYLNLGEGES